MVSEFLGIFFTTAFIIFFAEIADKTNLLAISLMSQTKQPKSVAIGGLIGIAIITLIAILFSSILERYIPANIVKIISGILFLALGIIGLLQNEEEQLAGNIEKDQESRNTITRSALLIGVAEFGDKSQIFVISSALVKSKVAVYFGAVFGMGVIMLLTMMFGEKMLTALPERKLHVIASILFIIIGIWILLI